MCGVRGTRQRRIRQVRLAEDGVHPHLIVGVEVGRIMSFILPDGILPRSASASCQLCLP